MISSSEDSKDSTYFQAELPVSVKSIETDLYEMLKRYGERIDKIQNDLEGLSQTSAETFNMVYEQQELVPTEAIKAIKQHIAVIEKAIIKVYQHIEKDSTGKELKSEQQLLRKAIEANQRNTTESNVSYLDWRQLTIIITATALAASLCSFFVLQAFASWKADQPQNPSEKILKTKIKKSSK